MSRHGLDHGPTCWLGVRRGRDARRDGSGCLYGLRLWFCRRGGRFFGGGIATIGVLGLIIGAEQSDLSLVGVSFQGVNI